MSRSSAASLSNAGIKQLKNGDAVIPSSTRADGSVRKEIRVKPGYKPPEDVEVYKNRTAEAFKNRGAAGVPGADFVSSQSKLSAAAQKNAKRKEARQRAAASEETVDVKPVEAVVENLELDKAKEARKLAKKLRQAKELQEKKEQGDGLLPEQLAKVIKISELIRQLDALGFDANGEEKAEQSIEEPAG